MRPALSIVAACVVVTAAWACTLDFGKFEGDRPPVGGAGGVGGPGTGASGGAGGAGGVGAMGGQGGMLPSSCTNGVQDGTESAVDCGGICPGCDNGEDCNAFDDCLSLYCAAGTCAPCATTPNCADAAGTYCDTTVMGGTCTPVKAGGTSCSGNDQCASTFCTDSVCCNVACNGTCESCLGAQTEGGQTGTCSPVTGTTDPSDECGAQVCNGVNACVDLCGFEPVPPGGMCPAACTGGCAAGTCTIDCSVTNCNAAVTCPAGFACNIVCNGNSQCQNGVFACPANYGCNVSCAGNQGCRDLTVNCSATGACDLLCGSEANVCSGADLVCAANDCVATCNGSSKPTVMCSGGACACTPCP